MNSDSTLLILKKKKKRKLSKYFCLKNIILVILVANMKRGALVLSLVNLKSYSCSFVFASE